MENKETNSSEHFKVTIFGSARIKQQDDLWQQIFKLAKMIAAEGKDVVTGGGPGLMEAASEGHFAGDKAGKFYSIGLQIKLPHEQRDANHLDIKKEFEYFSGRLDEFMRLSNIVVVAPGGIGTLLELMYTWQLEQVGKIKKVPIILMGKHWLGLLKWVEKEILSRKLIEKADLELLHVVETPEEAMDIIRTANKKFRFEQKN